MCFLLFRYVIQYLISANSQMSFVQSSLSVAILNANIVTWMSSKFYYIERVRISSLLQGKEMWWSVFTSAVNIYIQYSIKQNSTKDIIGTSCVN